MGSRACSKCSDDYKKQQVDGIRLADLLPIPTIHRETIQKRVVAMSEEKYKKHHVPRSEVSVRKGDTRLRHKEQQKEAGHDK